MASIQIIRGNCFSVIALECCSFRVDDGNAHSSTRGRDHPKQLQLPMQRGSLHSDEARSA